MNQKGYSPLSLLLVVVLGIFIIWELNVYVNYYSDILNSKPQIDSSAACVSGETDNCNDSNDVFVLPENSGPVCLSGDGNNCNDTNDVFLLP